MSSIVELVQADSEHHIQLSREIFKEYGDSLGVDLSFQSFSSELEGLPGLYAPPRGVILLAFVNGQLAGCGALRPLGAVDRACEMKRLYVRAAFRGQHLGKLIAEALMKRALECGYASMVLDTLPTMISAMKLYRTLGFIEIAPYYPNPIQGTVYMMAKLGFGE